MSENDFTPPPCLTHEAFNAIALCAKAGVSPFMVGPAGTGKTTIARQIAAALGYDFYYTGAVESSFQLKGFKDAHGNVARTAFRNAFENGGVFLFDELDASAPEALVSIHAALDNGILDTPEGTIINRHPNFLYLAAGNTWGNGATLDYMGRNPLDGATLDRYAFIGVGYDSALEVGLAKPGAAGKPTLDQKSLSDLYGRDILSLKPTETKPATWIAIVHQARKATDDLKLRHIVSMRPIVNGLKLLEAGMDLDAVFRAVVLKGLPEDDAEKLLKRVNMNVDEAKVQISPRRVANFRTSINDLSETLASLTATEQDLKDAGARARKLSAAALKKTGEMGSVLSEATGAAEKLVTARDMLIGITAAVPGVLNAAQQALGETETALQQVNAGRAPRPPQ